MKENSKLKELTNLEIETFKELEKRYQRPKFWCLGGRVWKTVLALFLALFLDSLRPGSLPFYAGVAAITCIQRRREDTLYVAVNREIGTLIGGFCGMGFLLLEDLFGGYEPLWLRYGIVALCAIFVISCAVFLARPKAVFLACIVYLSVVISHNGDVRAFTFSLNRIIDTSIGIGLAIPINMLPGTLKTPEEEKRRDRDPGGGMAPDAAVSDDAGGGDDDDGGE